MMSINYVTQDENKNDLTIDNKRPSLTRNISPEVLLHKNHTEEVCRS